MTDDINKNAYFTVIYNNYTGCQTRAILKMEDMSDMKFKSYEDAISWIISEAYDSGAIPIDKTHIIPYHRVLGFELCPEFMRQSPQPSQQPPVSQVSITKPQPTFDQRNKKRGRYGHRRHHGNNGNGNNGTIQHPNQDDVISLTTQNPNGGCEKKDMPDPDKGYEKKE